MISHKAEIQTYIKQIINLQQKADRLRNSDDFNDSTYKQLEYNDLNGNIIKLRLSIDKLLNQYELEKR